MPVKANNLKLRWERGRPARTCKAQQN